MNKCKYHNSLYSRAITDISLYEYIQIFLIIGLNISENNTSGDTDDSSKRLMFLTQTRKDLNLESENSLRTQNFSVRSDTIKGLKYRNYLVMGFHFIQ